MYFTKVEQFSYKNRESFRVYIEVAKDTIFSVEVNAPVGSPPPPHEFIINLWENTKSQGKWMLEAIEIYDYSGLDYYVPAVYYLP